MRSEEAGKAGGGGLDEGRVESALALKEEGLEKILQKADDLQVASRYFYSDSGCPFFYCSCRVAPEVS
ncbi:hypothetical protein CJ030_MR6G010779 [Morella rubra]|uniref:Uncharacterized protein n=1 Tax=Morella rubra TaxID=262757 RepID=A0A6A1VCK7_9ROSI|nr:hypothetical protein CJ030_MR6G010779 [Morella rubra]